MADNTVINAGSGGDTIATDELTTLNGGAVSGFKVQRVKVGHGTDATFTDAKGSTPLPVTLNGSSIISYRGRTSTFKTLGRAGTAGQKIFAIHNATGSGVLVDVHSIKVDVTQTAARVVEPPLLRLWKFTAVPTNGTAVTKVSDDSALSSAAAVTVWQDAQSDTANSATALTVTLPAGTFADASWGARALTLVGYEQYDKEEFLEGDSEFITLRALEGLAVFLDYTVATANPVTDKWVVTARWCEYTAAP